MYNDFDSYCKTLLDKSCTCTMEVKRLRTRGSEVFKNMNNLNPAYMEEIFHWTKWLTHKPNNKQVNLHKRPKYGDNGDNLIKFR